MTQKPEKLLDMRLRLILSQDCKVGDWVHNTTADCALHGYWHHCIGVRVGNTHTDIWLEMDEFENTDLHHIEIDEAIVVATHDPRGSVDRG